MLFGLRDCLTGNPVRFASFSEIPNQEQSSGESQKRYDPHRRYLFFGGPRSPYLGLQIFGIMLIGLGFTSLSKGISYSWAWSGHPLRTWGWG
jgi:hypothetical protein